MSGYVYILKSCKSDHYYIGSSADPGRRLDQHNSNAVRATRGKGPWQRVALVEFETPTAARQAESHLKKQKSRKIIEQVIAGRYAWPVGLNSLNTEL
jgi:putative endonuclease